MDKAFQRWSNDTSVLITREETVEPEHARIDRVTDELFKECESDVIVITADAHESISSNSSKVAR